MRPIMHTVRQKFSIGGANMATVRQKCIASQHRERKHGDRSSEMRCATPRRSKSGDRSSEMQRITDTVQQKCMIGKPKVATVRQKFVPEGRKKVGGLMCSSSVPYATWHVYHVAAMSGRKTVENSIGFRDHSQGRACILHTTWSPS